MVTEMPEQNWYEKMWRDGGNPVKEDWQPPKKAAGGRAARAALMLAKRPKHADGGGVPLLPERPDVAQYRAMDRDARDAWTRDKNWRSNHPHVVKPGDPKRDANFKAWFGDSKILDKTGEPLRAYHISNKNFTRFIPGGSYDEKEHESGPATWLSPYADKQPAAHHVGGYQGRFRDGTNVTPLHVSMKNPLVLDHRDAMDRAKQIMGDTYTEQFPMLIPASAVRKLREAGHDGIVYAGSNAVLRDEPAYATHALGEHPDREEEIISFDPQRQLKSAIGNNGRYDRQNSDINYDEGGAVAPRAYLDESGGFTHEGRPVEPNAPYTGPDAVGQRWRVDDMLVPAGETAPAQMTPRMTYRGGQQPNDYRLGRDLLGGGRDGDIPFASRWGLADGGAVDASPELTQQGLYSHAAQIAQTALQQQAPAAQVKATLLNKGVKPDELKWSGFDEKLGSKPMVSRDEVVQHFKAGLPNIQETTLGVKDQFRPGGGGRMASRPAKYSDYQLPGAENYREVLMHLPTAPGKYSTRDLDRGYHVDDAGNALPIDASKHVAAPEYRSSHWDEPNVLAHLRLSDRKLPGGKKALHLEELQSDWGQAGRDRGVKTGATQRYEDWRSGALERAKQKLAEKQIPDETAQNFLTAMGMGNRQVGHDVLAKFVGEKDHADTLWDAHLRDQAAVPAAPYVDSTAKWTDLGLKRALYEAAKGDYDRLLITPGEEQASRYDLSHKIKKLDYYPDKKYLHATTHDDQGVEYENVTPENLHAHVGKEAAENILKQPLERYEGRGQLGGEFYHSLEGNGLKVGGEGMKGYYDKILPTALQKLAKKHDPAAEVKLHGHTIVTKDMEGDVLPHDVREHHDISPEFWDNLHVHERNELSNQYRRDRPLTRTKLHALDITPKMRASILRGHAAYATGGSVPPSDNGIVQKALQVVPDDHPVMQQAQQILKTQLPQPKAKQDPMSAVHALSTTPQDQAEQVMGANADKGLIFPQDASANRLRMKLARHKKSAEKGEDLPGMPTNPRTVIKAPEGLPDFVAGRVTPEDWVSRHEKLLSPDEIRDSADWYKKVYGTFLQQTKGDEEQAKKYMRGWLVAQQNVDVSGAMNNVLLQNEQMKRGVPEDKMRAAGMPNPTAAARSVLADKPITGVGQKISDFVDAAEGKDVRSWMANHPDGGKPFVVDVHTGRDTGLVDQELINHLTRLGYDPKAIKKLKVDMHASPSETQYENRAHFGHELTNHLNTIGWQGKNDWTPSEVQAVGWMGMTKLTANQADDVVSGLDRNTRRLSMELAPGEGSPWHKKYGEAFSGLKPEDQYELTHHMTQKALAHASRIAGIDVRDIVHGTGGWQKFQNPSTVGQALATGEGAEIAANVLGHLLQQTEVWSNSVKPVTANPKGFAVDFIADGNHNLHTDEGLRDFWAKVMDADPLKDTKKALFQGYQPIRTMDGKVGIRALIDRGGVGTMKTLNDAVEGPIRAMVEGLPFDVHAKMHEAEILKARNDWKEDKNGQAYKSRLVDLLKRDPTAELSRAGQELEEEFVKKLREKGAKVGRPPKASGGSVHRDPYKHALRVVSTAGRYSRGGGSGKTDERSVVDRALQLTSKGYRK